MNSQNNRAWIAVVFVASILLIVTVVLYSAFGLTLYWSQQRAPEVTALLRINSMPAAATTHRDTHTALIMSPFVIQAALRQPGISQLTMLQSKVDPVGWTRDHLSVTAIQGSEIIRLNLASPIPEDGIVLVDAIVDAYLREVVSAERTQALEISSALKSARDLKREEVRKQLLAWSANDGTVESAEVNELCDTLWQMEDEHPEFFYDVSNLTKASESAAKHDALTAELFAERTARFRRLVDAAGIENQFKLLAELNRQVQKTESAFSSPRIQVLQSAAILD